MTDKSKFVLKLSGIDLENINAGDIGRLLNDFCKLLGNDYLFFDSIYSGSAVLKVNTDTEHYYEKLGILNSNIAKQANALHDINKVIRSYSKNFSNIEASIFASLTAVNDEDMELVHQIDFRKQDCSTFNQTETFIGRFFAGKLQKIVKGKDGIDQIKIITLNDEVIPVSVPKQISLDLASHLESLWKFNSLIEFTGKASYELQDSYKLTLKRFEATGFSIIKHDTSAKSWMDEFLSYGKSGWQDSDDSENTWLEERHT